MPQKTGHGRERKTMKEKPWTYYAGLLKEVLRIDYDDIPEAMEKITEDIEYHAKELQDRIDCENDYAFGRYTVNEYQKACEYIECFVEYYC